MNRAQIATFFDVSLTTVERWIREGCPVVHRGAKGKPWQLDCAQVHGWYVERERRKLDPGTADKDELERRRLAAQTLKAELELAQARAEVAPLWQMERAVQTAFAEVRANMRNLPARVVRMLIGETDETRFKAVLQGEIDQALDALSEADLLGDADLDGDEGADD